MLPNTTAQRMPSLDLGPEATPITPIVDAAPLPREGEDPHYPREYVLPVPHDFEWPRVEHFAFYDHTGNFPRAWSEIGWPGISVADRRTSRSSRHATGFTSSDECKTFYKYIRTPSVYKPTTSRAPSQTSIGGNVAR